MAVQLGTLDKAGLTALTMIEELNALSAEALITSYEWARTWLTDFASLELLHRVNNAARKILVRLKGKIDHDEAVDILLCRNCKVRRDTLARPVMSGSEWCSETPRKRTTWRQGRHVPLNEPAVAERV